jgi:hypothetical protein
MFKRKRSESVYIFDIQNPNHNELFDLCASKGLDSITTLRVTCDLLICLYCKMQNTSMPGFLDSFWHMLILETKLYGSICNDFGVSIIHHTTKTKETPDRVEAMKRAILSLEPDWEFFSSIWGGKIDDETTIFVKTIQGKTFSFIVNPKEIKVSELKELIRTKTVTPVDTQRIIFAGKQLDDGLFLSDYNIRQESTLHMIAHMSGC